MQPVINYSQTISLTISRGAISHVFNKHSYPVQKHLFPYKSILHPYIFDASLH